MTTVPTPSAFGAALRRSRLAAGLSQEALAERAGLSARAVSDLERGINRAPRADTLALLADALCLGPEDRAALRAAAQPAAQLAGAPDPPHNLPAPLTSFIGRERDVAETARRLGAGRLVTLTGTGGTGKTRLALRVAETLLARERFPGGVWLVEFAALTDPAAVPQAVATVVGVREEPGRPLLATLCDALRPERLLLVLDNCEHLVGACAALAEALLRSCPDVRILATGREPLGLAGETVWRVPSLALPALLTRSRGPRSRRSPGRRPCACSPTGPGRRSPGSA